MINQVLASILSILIKVVVVREILKLGTTKLTKREKQLSQVPINFSVSRTHPIDS
jgi:hypothetical protein